MTDDLVVLWRDRDPVETCYEIVQIGEGEFELRVLDNGRTCFTDESADFDELIERARAIRAQRRKSKVKVATETRNVTR